ncbi:hypothetical protein QO010_002143 [Caulobacter ginsengisoli]|uniref:Lipoprotein n=1 Tax=Caulobacter ginsengisoli TaxID=400775 RepID=A0ABU0IQS2_9CAUL|nr:hypothetical protein [Caulobacter ginsengisoli]MDQ0464362.1 hypothetical protein [Caulobacter ginsengisoli]
MSLRSVLAATPACLLLAACATGGAPSFADAGRAADAAPPPEETAALPPGPILAASGNAILPIYDLSGGLITPSISIGPVSGLQARATAGVPSLLPGGAAILGPASATLQTGASPSVLVKVDLGGSALVSPRPVTVTSGPLLGLGGANGPLAPVLGPLLPGRH